MIGNRPDQLRGPACGKTPAASAASGRGGAYHSAGIQEGLALALDLSLRSVTEVLQRGDTRDEGHERFRFYSQHPNGKLTGTSHCWKSVDLDFRNKRSEPLRIQGDPSCTCCTISSVRRRKCTLNEIAAQQTLS